MKASAVTVRVFKRVEASAEASLVAKSVRSGGYGLKLGDQGRYRFSENPNFAGAAASEAPRRQEPMKEHAYPTLLSAPASVHSRGSRRLVAEGGNAGGRSERAPDRPVSSAYRLW